MNVPFENGLVHGLVRYCRPDGTPGFDAQYVCGKLHGLLALYDDTGNPLQRAEYRDGRQHGTTTSYAGGRLQSSRQYRDGLLDGEMLCYDASGIVVARLPYRLGKLHGNATFLRDGVPVRRLTYANGEAMSSERVTTNNAGAHAIPIPTRTRRRWALRLQCGFDRWIRG